MKKKIFVLAFNFLLLSLGAQNYTFNSTMSREVLDNYLDRAITMQTLSDIQGAFQPSEAQRLQDIEMIDDVGAKFVGRLGYWWENGWGQANLDAIFDKTRQNICEIKSNDPEVIGQGAIFEYVSATVNEITVPNWVFQAFGQTIVSRKFNYQNMLYSTPIPQGMSTTEGNQTPDITKLETRMWFYYLAVRYIEAGCEALHFGNIGIMNKRDSGNALLWNLLQKVRAYAASRNNIQLACTNSNILYRGLVICDAHVGDGGAYFDSDPVNPLPISQRQLLFDFHSLGTYYTETANCTSNQMEVKLEKLSNQGLIGRSNGGLNPLGWICVNNPYLLELDNFGIYDNFGCGYPDKSAYWNIYGFDDISWYANQNFNYRDLINKYTYYKLKCLDKNGHFQFAGRRGYNTSLISSSLYRAHANSFNQQLTIKNIWNGSHSSPINWGKYNFTDENVINQPSPAHVKSDLTFVGNNKVYYIGNDNRIHGYIKVSDAWLTVSPSYAAHYAGQNINSQVQAAGDLISNPSGTFLYYRGTDGYVYRYQVNNDWSYTYSAMPTNSSMQQQGITAVNSLICPSDSRIYYIANEPSNGNAKRVHGFIRNVSTGNWSTISPSYSAHYAGQSINSQVQAAGNLISNPSGTFLYYKGIDGYVYRYQITDDLNYTYSAMPTNSAMQQQGITVVSSLICPINDRIYYIANEPSNGNAKRVHGFARNVSTGNWSTISPSYSAHYAGQSINSQAQATTSVTLAYNPDNSTLIYTGLDNQLHGFNVINSIDYTYFNIMQVSYNQRPTNSLKFKEANNVYYISSGDAKIHYFKFSENYCANAIVQQVEPNCCQSADNYLYGKENDKNIYDGIILNSNEKRILTVFPNPSNDIISIKLNIKNDSNTVVRIISTEGLLMREFLTFEEITQINLAEFPNGIYYIVTSSGEGTLTAKFIVQH